MTKTELQIALAAATETNKRTAEDGREFEYVFETGDQGVPKTVGEKSAADWVNSFYHVQIGTIESQKFRTH
jgi:hypothetical protein